MTHRDRLTQAWAKAKRRSWLLIVPVLLLLGVKLGGLLTAPPPTIPRAEDIELAKRELSPADGPDLRAALNDPSRIGANGVVEPAHREIRVAAAVAGTIAKVSVSEGQWVEAGQVLVELESSLEQAAVRTARAELDAARASLQRTVAGDRTEQRQALEAEARQSEARAALSEATLRRTESLAAAGAIALEELDRARKQAVADRAAADASDARRRSSVNGARLEDRASARAQLEGAEARLAEAEARLAQTIVLAPEAGEILQVKVRIGEHYQPGPEPLVVLGDTRTLVARVDVDERDVGDLAVGARATLRVAAWPNRAIDAEVVEIGRRMGRKNIRSDDPVERNDVKILEVLLAIDARDLRVGQRVVASIDRGAPKERRPEPVADAARRHVPPS